MLAPSGGGLQDERICRIPDMDHLRRLGKAGMGIEQTVGIEAGALRGIEHCANDGTIYILGRQ